MEDYVYEDPGEVIEYVNITEKRAALAGVPDWMWESGDDCLTPKCGSCIN